MARDHAEAPDAIRLVEEAVQLLRAAPVSWWAHYAVGLSAWIAGVLAAWAHISWFKPSPEVRAWIALGLVGLFLVLKTVQAECCHRLLAQRGGVEPGPWNAARRWATAWVQLRVQAHGVVLLPLALLLTVPVGWVMAYYQSATALADHPRLAAEARSRALDWPSQNHHGLLWISLLGLAVWVNIASCFYVLPWLANRFLGLENLFALRGIALLNTTFLAMVTLLAWGALDPLLKAFYVLRVFYGQARRNGQDLRLDLARARRPRRAYPGFVASVLVLLAGLALAPTARAAEPLASTAEVRQLDQAIDRVLQHPDFRWSLEPLPVPPDESSWARRFIRAGAETVRSILQKIEGWWRALRDWLVGSRPRGVGGAGSGAGAVGWLFPVVLLSLALIAALGVWLIWRTWKGKHRGPVLAAQASPRVQPRLEDENVSADQLPVEGWLALARERMGAEDWRLALRALYLAQLARLAGDGWLVLSRAKTNRDYEQELKRRASGRDDIVSGFRRRRRRFDGVWYGREEPQAEEVQEWWRELARPGGTP
jgi:hypothetical protein